MVCAELSSPERHDAFAAERAATLADGEVSEVEQEDLDWDATVGDGIEP